MGVFSEMSAAAVPSAFQDESGSPVFFEPTSPTGFYEQPMPAPIVHSKPAANKAVSPEKVIQQAPEQTAVQNPVADQPVIQTDVEAERDTGSKAENLSDKEKRSAHEAAEAKRKTEWEEKQKAKKAAEQEQLGRLAALNDDEAASAAAKRIGTDTERLTRRNMKECISEHIQTMCFEDPGFARKVLHPRKSMIHCIWYINRKAREFAEQEMKDNGMKPENGIYGCDVPDDLCYGWAVEYFNDPNAKEDEEKEEKFTSKPYVGGAAKSKDKPKPKPAEKKTEQKTAAKKETSGQLSLGDLV